MGDKQTGKNQALVDVIRYVRNWLAAFAAIPEAGSHPGSLFSQATRTVLIHLTSTVWWW